MKTGGRWAEIFPESEMATSTVEDYLKSILQITGQSGAEVTVGRIAADLKVTPGTVSSMMRTLSDEGLIEYLPRRSVTLLPEGRRQALQVVRRHRLLETFLVRVLKLDWAEVHEEAEILEHVVSDRLLQRMDDMLDHPSHDPHGDPIPDVDGHFADQDLLCLSEAGEGKYRIVRVDDSDPEFLDWVKVHHLMPGNGIEIKAVDSIANVIEIAVPGEKKTIRIGKSAAASILVEQNRG